jgi:hypothetical protein
MWGLGHLMPYRYTQVVLLALGGVLLAVGAWTGPETVNADLAGTSQREHRRSDAQSG